MAVRTLFSGSRRSLKKIVSNNIDHFQPVMCIQEKETRFIMESMLLLRTYKKLESPGIELASTSFAAFCKFWTSAELAMTRFSRAPEPPEPPVGPLLNTGMIPIAFARRIALPSLRWDFQVSLVWSRGLIRPKSET